MAQRHKEALIIIDGASNALAISNAIANAVREIYDEKGSVDKDPAVALMVTQLHHVTNTGRFDDLGAFGKAMDECKAKMRE